MGYNFIIMFLFFSAPSLLAFDKDITEEVESLINNAIKTNKLFILKDNKKRKQSGLVQFNFQIPQHIDEDPMLVKQFLDCMRDYIQKNDVVGPQRKPLALVPSQRREILIKKPVDEEANSSNFGKDFDFEGSNRRLGGF